MPGSSSARLISCAARLVGYTHAIVWPGENSDFSDFRPSGQSQLPLSRRRFFVKSRPARLRSTSANRHRPRKRIGRRLLPFFQLLICFSPDFKLYQDIRHTAAMLVR